MDKTLKNSISHRGKSLQLLKEYFVQQENGPPEEKKSRTEIPEWENHIFYPSKHRYDFLETITEVENNV